MCQIKYCRKGWNDQARTCFKVRAWDAYMHTDGGHYLCGAGR